MAFGESTYHAGVPWKGQIPYAKEAKTNPESRLRAWGLDQILSGDIITEQNIHTIDVASWICRLASSLRLRDGRPKGSRLRRLLGHVQRDVQVLG